MSHINFYNWLKQDSGHRFMVASYFSVSVNAVNNWVHSVPNRRVPALCRLTGLTRLELLTKSDDKCERLQPTDLSQWIADKKRNLTNLSAHVGRKPSTVMGWIVRVPDEHLEKVASYTGLDPEALRIGKSRAIRGKKRTLADASEMSGFQTDDLEIPLDAILMGTPPPGRSALDMMPAEDRERLLTKPKPQDDEAVEPLNLESFFDKIKHVANVDDYHV